ncbi:MAG: metallophosphoesterase [Lentisphaerae bacterium]|nr:metallophosphoesterase [Lentisphaerota bacterium]
MNLTRREFVKGGLASLGFLALPGTPMFAAPPGWKAKKKPNLVFGVMSDTHMRCHYDGVRFYDHNGWTYGDAAVVMALRYFKKHGADAVLHLGDITDCGMVREMEFYKEAFDKVYGRRARPVSMMVMGNHDIYGDDEWAKGIAHSKDPAVYKKFRLGSHNLSVEMERIWGEPYENVWHREVKGYHFFGFGWPRFTGEDMNEATPYRGRLYHDSPQEGRNYVRYVHSGLWMAELVRREREAGRLDPQKPFFTSTHALHYSIDIIDNELKSVLGLKKGQLCNGLGLHGHGHGSDAHWRFNWGAGLSFPRLMCSTLAYWKNHGGEGESPRFANGFGDGKVVNPGECVQKSDHALLVRVYDDILTIHRFWVGVLPKRALGSLGEDWVMPLNWGTGNGELGTGHPFKRENYVKVAAAPEFPTKTKLDVGKTNDGGLRIKIPKADGNPKARVYGYQIVVAGDDRKAALKKNCYARGYNMGMGHEPEGGVTTVEILASELPAGKKLAIGVRPCSSLGTKGKLIATTFRV